LLKSARHKARQGGEPRPGITWVGFQVVAHRGGHGSSHGAGLMLVQGWTDAGAGLDRRSQSWIDAGAGLDRCWPGLDRCWHIPEQLSPAGPLPGTVGVMCFGDGSPSSTPGHEEGRSAVGILVLALPLRCWHQLRPQHEMGSWLGEICPTLGRLWDTLPGKSTPEKLGCTRDEDGACGGHGS